jgi:hypothetical protein
MTVVVVAVAVVVAGAAFQRRTTVRTTAGGGSGPGHICRRVYLEYKFSFRKRLKSGKRQVLIFFIFIFFTNVLQST